MQPVNTGLLKGRRSTQRERLLTGVVRATNRDGYAGANVSAIIEEAGVSRPTFYEYFADRDDCLRAGFAAAQEELAAQLHEAMHAQPGMSPSHVVVATLIDFASTQSARARFLMGEMLAAGPEALDARDRGIEELAAIVVEAEDTAAGTSVGPDVPIRALIGGIQRLLAARLRRGPIEPEGLLEEVLGWMASYERPATGRRWREGSRASFPAVSTVTAIPLRPPPALGPGRPRSSPGEVAENHRQRLLFAAASLAAEQGYTATTVAELTKHAQLDRRAFYSIFQDKQDLFMALHEFVFQRLLAVTAGAFFGGASWPQRMWAGVNGMCEFLHANPTIAHVGFVEAYAVGPGAVQRIEDSVSALGVFLQEGYRYEQKQGTPTELALSAITWTQFEILHRAARRHTRPRIAGLVGTMTFIALAPFLGPAATDRAIDEAVANGTTDRKRRAGDDDSTS
ncbi:MAG TPA: TetR/AcrR family transcriptional regulator [Solirubrobacteraceae bacterium]|nr:TetR/AcrR family transcriptional regulator [Solirubrobacteraceae bacterium]